MSEEKEQKLEENLVTNEEVKTNDTKTLEKNDEIKEGTEIVNLDKSETTEQTLSSEETSVAIESKEASKEKESVADVKPEEAAIDEETLTDAESEEAVKEEETVADVAPEEEVSKENDAVLEEIDESNAEDAEDNDNQHRHVIPLLDYHSMSIENLTGEFQKLVKNEKIQAIKKHVDGIKYEFDLKFQEFLEHKKEEFITNGGNEIDFKYNAVAKKKFNEVYSEYRERRNDYYKGLENNLKTNLAKRLEIIEELKSLVNVEEDINTTYKNFKDVQERWRNTGPVPRTHYNNVWKTYQHHIEIFYDFLHLNRELRDLDFKHNLEEKQKLVVRAEALANEPDLGIAFRELQTLHKVWKEDIGPVGKQHREQIWELFSDATKVLHQRRQDYYKDQDKVYEQNLQVKKEIITNINAIAEQVSDNHKALQQQIKLIEEQRNAFFTAGKVPQKVNERTWAEFKEAVRNFNRGKNAYYKNLKKDQQENLDKKRALLNLAISLKDSDDWDVTTQEMKRIQNEWKNIGHVPRKYSDKIWSEFKNACNHYFDRLHALKNKAQADEIENLAKKDACMNKLKDVELSGNREQDMTTIKAFIEEWKAIGRVPFNKKNINQKFNNILDAIFKKLNIGHQESELLKYGNKIQELAKEDNERAISNERTFIRRKIEESKTEIRQLETNLQFFSNASEDNPLVQDVIKRVETHKRSLETWLAKLKKLNILAHNLNKEVEAVETNTSSEE